MPLHRELFTDLPPAEEMRRDIAGNLVQKYNADGFYILAQLIAEKYGEQAYTLAEEVFKEMGLQYDAQALRTPDLVRRIDYNFAGSNIYNLQVKAFVPEMAAEVVRLYNVQIRKISYAALTTREDFLEHIAGAGTLRFCPPGPQAAADAFPDHALGCIRKNSRAIVPARSNFSRKGRAAFSGLRLI